MRVLLTCVLLLCACGSDSPAADAAPGPDGLAADGSADDPPPKGRCRERGDCDSSGDLCYGPNESRCGAAPQEECASDLDCGKGEIVCQAVVDSCSADGIGSMCAFLCSAESPCGEGFECTKSGHCR